MNGTAGAATKASNPEYPPIECRSLRIAGANSSRPSADSAVLHQHVENGLAFADVFGMADTPTAAVKRSVRIAGHATSVSLEPEFWEALREIAVYRRISVNALLVAIDSDRSGNLSSAVRLFVLDSCRRGELARAENGRER
ncbi:MAG TPA: ribbon-helix-helix domain-containing protein [Stellaceae bacterium]|jgi:predicted DNA-binding ribbon-helix-helix protein|nr:ribbon-helix-helix domain-containing protein [Stellaceae bacterium]